MDDKKIVIDINSDGSIKAETFGIQGTKCLDELDAILKDIALTQNIEEKEDMYQEELVTEETVTDYI